jgi:hypothetical protein
MESRSRRDVSKKSAAKLAIERMMAVKNGTAKRSEQLEVRLRIARAKCCLPRRCSCSCVGLRRRR